MSSTKTTRLKSPLRRSNRKIKKIFRQSPPWDTCRQHSRISSGNRLSFNIEMNCKKMMEADSQKNSHQLLTQMGMALRAQCQKLQETFKIKLSLDQIPPFDPTCPQKRLKEEPILLDRVEEQLEGEERVWSVLGRDEISMDIWSLPEEVEEKPVLKRHESARLLCDNYEKQELIYSVETLIPRLLREDLDLNFSQPH